MIRSASASSSAANPRSRSLSLAAVIRSKARYGAGAAPLTLRSAKALPRATAASHASPRSTDGRETTTEPVSTLLAQSNDCSRKSAESSSTSPIPSLTASGPLSILFWFRAFSTTTLTALSAPIRFGSRKLPPQPGSRPRKTSGVESIPAATETVRYDACSATSSPPPSATPLTKANDGLPPSCSLRITPCPILPRLSACSRSVSFGTPDRSAPAARMNGLPVMPMATISSRASAASIALFSSARPRGPKVFGLVWSWPLSSVMSAIVPALFGSTTSREGASVTSSSFSIETASSIRSCRLMRLPLRSSGSPR